MSHPIVSNFLSAYHNLTQPLKSAFVVSVAYLLVFGLVNLFILYGYDVSAVTGFLVGGAALSALFYLAFMFKARGELLELDERDREYLIICLGILLFLLSLALMTWSIYSDLSILRNIFSVLVSVVLYLVSCTLYYIARYLEDAP